jgi:3-methyladenine DNA glycosylase AlkD
MDIFELFLKNKNETQAPQMAAYMKNHFPFLGIRSPLRKELSKAFLQEKKKVKSIDWNFVYDCFELAEREYQYLALDYLITMKKFVEITDMEHVENLIKTKNWWDSVDSLDQIAGALVLKFPELTETYIKKWMKSDNIWLVRVSIDYQLEFKEKTDQNMLTEAILANLGTKEFFINKAIGWSLRQYSKFNKAWVQDFVDTHKAVLHPLSVREACKYL